MSESEIQGLPRPEWKRLVELCNLWLAAYAVQTNLQVQLTAHEEAIRLSLGDTVARAVEEYLEEHLG